MPENSCDTRECPHETRIAIMESKIKALETGQDREESFRKTYYADREARIKRDAELDATLDIIKKDVSTLVRRQTEKDEKPRKWWEEIVKTFLTVAVTAAVTYALGRLGIFG